MYKDISEKYLTTYGVNKGKKDDVPYHDVKIGDTVRVRIKTSSSNSDGREEGLKEVCAVVDGIYPYFVLLRTIYGYNRCMWWDEFRKQRVYKVGH